MYTTNNNTSSRRPPQQSQERQRVKCIVLGAAGAGKTSLLRRYFRGTFEGTRVPTLGSDFYTGRVVQQQEQGLQTKQSQEEKKDGEVAAGAASAEEDNNVVVSVQVWDTAGRERNAKHHTSLTDDFFRHADAAMLVYDATSSTSFTQLLKWHSELRQRNFDRPILIVANKMDIIKERQLQRQRQQVPSSANNKGSAPHNKKRDIMGIKGQFKGKDSRYEYRVDTTNTPATIGSAVSASASEAASTYLATDHAGWTTDGSYLDSVLHSESRSHPDRDMVLLWCMRNHGLHHVEASALDGTGVEEAMQSLVSLALAYKEEKQKQEEIQFQQQTEALFQTNKALDLHQRYAPQRASCFGVLFSFCKPPNHDG